MLIFIIGILLLTTIGLIPDDNDSAYEEYCRNECWSRRKPCCYR